MQKQALSTPAQDFFGWKIVFRGFILAVFGWGLGFYGPAIYLHTVVETRIWPIALVSSAVTVHFLSGAVVIAFLPRLYARFGLRWVTRLGAATFAIGLCGWAAATSPLWLFAAAFFTGCGWVTMGAAAINAVISPWFSEKRPKALSIAYNGASIGGVLFSPLLVILIAGFGFQAASLAISIVLILAVWSLTCNIFGTTPDFYGQSVDGQAANISGGRIEPSRWPSFEGGALWRDQCFVTLAMAMAFSLFAQVGLLAHLFSIIVPVFGKNGAGMAVAAATASAIIGRTGFGWYLSAFPNRRMAAALSLVIQILGIAVIAASQSGSIAYSVAGLILFGLGIGNATSLPPLIAQSEFSKDDAARVIPVMIALAQAGYAFAPAIFGFVRAGSKDSVFILSIAVMAAALASYMSTSRKKC